MKSSPHRPLILKRRKLPLSHGDVSSSTLAGQDSSGQGNGSLSQQQARTVEHSTNRKTLETQKFPAGIKIISHPAMPVTPVMAFPAGTDVQTIIEALAAKRKECGSNGPNKFIISSGSSSPTLEARELSQLLKSEDEHSIPYNKVQEEEGAGLSSGALKGMAFWASESQSTEGEESEGNSSGEAPSCGLDSSLTNIQWLGKMSSDGLSPCSVKKETEKENQTPKQETAVKESFAERPPYSYMAMIQFAINSTEKKRMTLKDIYTWIEDHFPYFKHVAKPGWKNSIRHNLSLHDMFVRETSANGKISFWTIHPEANRYLTLDQVFKQQKRHTPDLQKNSGGTAGSKSQPQPARRKMKPLLPRVNSYLVPIQFPLSQSLILQPSAKISLPVSQSVSDPAQSCKRVRIAPKVLPTSVKPTPFSPEISIKEEVFCGEESSLFASRQSAKEDACQVGIELFPAVLSIKKESDFFHSGEWALPFQPALPMEESPVQDEAQLSLFLPGPEKQKGQLAALQQPPSQEALGTKRHEWHEISRSRRKQHLSLPCLEEPLLPLQSSSGSDSFTLEHSFPSGQGGPCLGNAAHLNFSCGEYGPLKTPIKWECGPLKTPASSTPCKMPTPIASLLVPDPWRLVPLVKETSEQDFSPRRSPPVPLLYPQENLDISSSVRPSMFDSPQPLLLNTEAHDVVLGPLMSSPASSNYSPPEFQASVLSENCSLRDGLVPDTMNDSLSKILLDVSFPGFDEDNLGTDLSWSQFIPDLK
ncbi:forkhead box protein M1 isoform X2 [Eublepharis macularius]|uniref:Forkhead box protein M1 n=1 Tax=Eublepharis macularius TaxID=481883 RepID=A0AA97LHY8_EUBMA|nr:forkhead box protein M1 isoform X2 [Eublepharis macularius]